MNSIIVSYRARGTSHPWRKIELTVNEGETPTDRISHFEDENYGTVELRSTGDSVQLIRRKEL